jgi:hypothetical protein
LSQTAWSNAEQLTGEAVDFLYVGTGDPKYLLVAMMRLPASASFLMKLGVFGLVHAAANRGMSWG